jgi:hypothetical protein
MRLSKREKAIVAQAQVAAAIRCPCHHCHKLRPIAKLLVKLAKEGT